MALLYGICSTDGVHMYSIVMVYMYRGYCVHNKTIQNKQTNKPKSKIRIQTRNSREEQQFEVFYWLGLPDCDFSKLHSLLNKSSPDSTDAFPNQT